MRAKSYALRTAQWLVRDPQWGLTLTIFLKA